MPARVGLRAFVVTCSAQRIRALTRRSCWPAIGRAAEPSKETRDGKAMVTGAANAAPEVVHCARRIGLGNVHEEPRSRAGTPIFRAEKNSYHPELPGTISGPPFATWIPGHRGQLNSPTLTRFAEGERRLHRPYQTPPNNKNHGNGQMSTY